MVLIYFLWFTVVVLSFVFFFILGVLEGVWCCVMLTVFIVLILSVLGNAWFSYGLFMIITGGLLILFMYVSSISPSSVGDNLYSLMLAMAMGLWVIFALSYETFMCVFSKGVFMKLFWGKCSLLSFFFFFFLFFFLFFVGLMFGEFWGPLRKVYYV